MDRFGINLSGTFSAPSGSLLLYDFDNGTAAHDAFGQLFGVHDLGLGKDEGPPPTATRAGRC